MSTETPAIMRAGAQSTLVGRMAEKYGVDASKFYNAVITTIFPTGTAKPGSEPKPGKGLPPTEPMVMAFLMVCDQYDLNPFLREIYPFIDQNGNLRCIVGIDGWIKVALRHSEYDGHEFIDNLDNEKNLVAVTCRMFRKDRTRPVIMVEYMQECKRDTDPWKNWPYRMLHHKAFIQTARYALGMGSLMDEDEFERIKSVEGVSHEIIAPRRMSETRAAQLPEAQPSNMPATNGAPAKEPVAARAAAPAAAPAQAQQTDLLGEPEGYLSTGELNELFKVGYANSVTLAQMKTALKDQMKLADTNRIPKSLYMQIKELFEAL